MTNPVLCTKTMFVVVSAMVFGVQCNDSPSQFPTSVRIVTYEEYLMLRPAGHAGAPDLRDAWEIIGDEGKLKSKGGDGFTWIWLNPDGSFVECNFDGPLCFDREGEIRSDGSPYDVDNCFSSFQYMRSCSQSGL